MPDNLHNKLKAIAETVNLFKSEAVQLRVVELLLGQLAPLTSDHQVQAPVKTARNKNRMKSGSAGSTNNNLKPVRSARGSGGTITALLNDGFFKSPKTIGAIIEHCRSTRGLHFKANECSPPLLRLLRDEKLTRRKNKEGQYEYSEA